MINTSDCPVPNHKTLHDHSFRREDGVLIWICSACNKRAPWSESWSYFGSIECPRCWVANIERVFCSDACRPVEKAPARRRAGFKP